MAEFRPASLDRSVLVVVVAASADALVTVFRFVVAGLTGSSALLAQAFQAASETANQALMHAGWAYAALAIAFILDGSSLLVARRQARREHGGSLLAYLRTSKNPEISVVILQDSAALVGLGIATVTVTISLMTGTPAVDGIGSLSIGLLVAIVAFVLAHRMKSFLIGESAPTEEVEAIRRIILDHRHVRSLVSLRTLYHGPDELVVEAQVAFDEQLEFRGLAEAIDEIEAGIRDQLPSARLVAIEPAVAGVHDPDVPPWQQSTRVR